MHFFPANKTFIALIESLNLSKPRHSGWKPLLQKMGSTASEKKWLF